MDQEGAGKYKEGLETGAQREGRCCSTANTSCYDNTNQISLCLTIQGVNQLTALSLLFKSIK